MPPRTPIPNILGIECWNTERRQRRNENRRVVLVFAIWIAAVVVDTFLWTATLIGGWR